MSYIQEEQNGIKTYFHPPPIFFSYLESGYLVFYMAPNNNSFLLGQLLLVQCDSVRSFNSGATDPDHKHRHMA